MKGQTNITFDASVGISQATNLPKMMDTKTYAQALVDYAGISASEVSDYLDGSNPGIDWTDQMFRTGVTQTTSLSFQKALKELKRMFPLTIWVMKVSLTK